MAGASAELTILVLLSLTSLSSSSSSSSSSARSIALQSSPHFDTFVLFGQIDLMNFKERTSYCRLHLCVELGNQVWLQDVESRYYTFQLPTINYSGLVGRLSLCACDEHAATLWNQSFSVQCDVGAYRLDITNAKRETVRTATSFNSNFQVPYISNNVGLDIYSGKILSTRVGLARELQGRTLNGLSRLKSKQARSEQNSLRLQQSNEQEATHPSVALPESYPNHPSTELKFTGQSSKMQPGNTELLKVAYPQQMMLYAVTIQKCYLVFLVVCFALIQLSSALLHKSFLLLEASVPAGNELAVGSVLHCNIDPGTLCTCESTLVQNRGYFYDSKNGQDLPPAGRNSLEEAWHVAEQYLNEAIDDDCQGAYFSYNCTTPQQGTHESVLGRWNRDNAGRLIRQLWP